MSKRKKVLLTVLGTPLVWILAAGCVIRIIYLRDARRAEALLNDVRSLRVGESRPNDVQRIIQKYGSNQGEAVTYTDSGCPPGDGVSYWINVGHKVLFNWGLDFPSLGFVFRPRAAYANLLVKGGKLCWVKYGVDTWPAPHERPLKVQGAVISAEYAFPGTPPFRVQDEGGNIVWFDVQATSEAQPEDRQKALAFDLSCLRRFGGCRAVCELMPAAWLDWREQMRKEGYPLPEEADDPLNDRRCEKLVQQSQQKAQGLALTAIVKLQREPR